jgi:hypothetical protein
MPYSLKQAAEATGKTKPTILRAIQTSKISATRHEVSGAWQIEPAELHRVYPPKSESVAQQDNFPTLTQDETVNEIPMLRRELQLKDEQLAAFREERQRERAQFEGTIDDLRERLDREGEERRRLTAILTDQRATKAHDVIVTPPPTSHTLSGSEFEAPGKVAGNGADTAAARKAPAALKPPPTAKRKGLLGWLRG